MARSRQNSTDEAVWLRQPGEREKPYAAFQCYLDLGDERTISAVGKKLVKSRNLIDRWAQEFNWKARAAAYDNYLIADKAKKHRREMEARYERFGKVGDVAYAHAATYIRNIDPAKLTHRQAVELLMLSMQAADKSKSVLVQSEREAVEIEVAKRRLDLEFIRLEAAQSATAVEDTGSNFEEALRDTADDAWGDYDQSERNEVDEDE